VKLVDRENRLYFISEHQKDEKKQPTKGNSTIDDKLKLLLGSACFQIGQPIAIECFTPDPLHGSRNDENFTPSWRKWHSESSAIGTTGPSPNILYINEFKPQNAGVYLCRTKDVHGRVVEVGVEFKVDAKNATLIVVNSMEESVTGENGDGLTGGHLESDERFGSSSPPNIRITFSDKLALARGERVELICESGKDKTLSL
jgi:hypothetical protein